MKKQLHILKGLTFSYYATSAVLLPFLPIYFEMKGYTALQIGLLLTIGPFMAIFAQPITGYISDRLNTVKAVIFVVWLLTVLSSVGLFVSHEFVLALLFVMLLHFFMMPSVPLLDSMTITSALKAGRSYGSVRLWGSIGFTTIALIGGPILGVFGGVENMQYLYWLLWLFPFILLYYLRDESSGGQQVSLGSLHKILKNYPFLWFLFLVFLLSIPHRMNDSLFGLYLYDLGASNTMIGLAWALAAASEIPTFALLSRFMHKYHELALLGIVSFIYTIRWLIYALIDSPWVLIFMQASHSITFAVFWIVALHYTVRLVPAEFRTTGQSLLSAVFMGLAGITGGIVGGWIKDEFGGAGMYYFGAGVTFLACILLVITHAVARRKTNSLEENML